ncbi:MAG TPA: type II CAAX endopeptidase family protein [Chitinophagaceae bacterium]|nr:type II CAAX endopeptidase family protein [Chitinophagaceae bacterium]
MESPGKQGPGIQKGWLRVVVFCFCFAGIVILGSGLYAWISKRLELPEQLKFFLGFVVLFLLSLLAVLIFRRWVDRASFISLGFPFKHYRRDALIGFLLAIVLLAIESLVLFYTGHLVWTGINFQPADLFTGMLIMIMVAISEEAVFRGYILHNLMQSLNKWIALAITSLLFALFHAFNPNIDALALVNIFLSGFVMGLNYVYTGNLWFAIMFHFSWNFFLGPILGFEVSGVPLASLLEQEVEGPRWLTGGEFGLEGSAMDGLLSIITFLLLYQPMKRLAAPHLANSPNNV